MKKWACYGKMQCLRFQMLQPAVWQLIEPAGDFHNCHHPQTPLQGACGNFKAGGPNHSSRALGNQQRQSLDNDEDALQNRRLSGGLASPSDAQKEHRR